MLKAILKNHKIILASGSPRRQQFFKDLDLNFEIRLKDIEEIYPDTLKAEEITNFLAELKANAFEGELNENEILVTSDTIVWHKNNALGKPKDYEDAFQILKSLSDDTIIDFIFNSLHIYFDIYAIASSASELSMLMICTGRHFK